MNEASASDGIPTELFQNLKDDAVKVVHSTCQQIWKTKQWPQDWKRSVFIPTPKKGNAKECSNYRIIALISHAKKAMLKFSKPGFNDTWSESDTTEWLNWAELIHSTSSGSRMVLSSVQLFSCVRLFVTPWTAAACQALLCITNSQSLLKLTSIASVMSANHHSFCCPLLLLPSIFSSIRVLSKKSVLCIRWPKYWSFSFSISPSNEYSGLISFMIDWFDFLAIQRTLKSLLQNHSSKASILWCSAFFMVQLSHPYMTTGKHIALTRHVFVWKIMSLLFNMLPRLVIPFLPRSKCILISWPQSPSAVILEPKQIVSHCLHCFPIYLPWSDVTRWHDLSFWNVEF